MDSVDSAGSCVSVVRRSRQGRGRRARMNVQGKDLGADPNYVPPPRLNGKVRRGGCGCGRLRGGVLN